MLDALLLDLDGTLLGLDVGAFLPRYFQSIVEFVAPALPGFPLSQRLLLTVQEMLKPRAERVTHAELFGRLFFEGVPGADASTLRAAFDRYYEEVFPTLSTHTVAFPEAPAVVSKGRAHARRLVLATNPLFPRQATLQRVRWAGLDPEAFDLITTYEDAYYAKPDPLYYKDILERVGAGPEHSWMAGNDLLEDGSAKEAGLSFFFVDGPYALRRAPSPRPDRVGTLLDLEAFIGSL